MNRRSKFQLRFHRWRPSDKGIHKTPAQQLLYEQQFLIALIHVVKETLGNKLGEH